VVVEFLGGIDDLPAIVDEFEPTTERTMFTTNEQERTANAEFLASGAGTWCFFEEEAFADDGTLVQVEHLPAASGSRELAVVVAHGFMLHSGHSHVRRVASWLHTDAGVVLVDMRGHGSSGGASTLGWQEVRDVEVAASWARLLGYQRVVTLGFSLGAAVVLRHAALYGGVERVAAVSGPGQWYFRGTSRMRLLHQRVLTPTGRLVIRLLRRTRVSSEPWGDPRPIDPVMAAEQVAVPLLVVHGDRDNLFPTEHAWRVRTAAGPNGELWLVPGFGHAEVAVDERLAGRIATWLRTDG
jgi:pimeloyl-ACP methyl ester carboxylesterase